MKWKEGRKWEKVKAEYTETEMIVLTTVTGRGRRILAAFFWLYAIYGIYMLYTGSIYCAYGMGWDVRRGEAVRVQLLSPPCHLPPGSPAVAAVRHLECRLLCVARAQLWHSPGNYGKVIKPQKFNFNWNKLISTFGLTAPTNWQLH